MPLLLDSADYIDRMILERGGYETQAVHHLIDRAQTLDARLFVDVGANLGIYAIAAARAGIERVIAFEPDPRNRNRLAANVWLNELDQQIDIRPVAICSTAGTAMFNLARDPQELSSGQSGLDQPPGVFNRITVQTTTLDQEIGVTGSRLAIKIDVEGRELQVIHGAAATLGQNTCIVQVEVWEEHRRPVDVAMRELGYRGLGRAPGSREDWLYVNDT